MTKEFKWNGKEVEKKLYARAEQALDKVAILTTNTAKDSMDPPKSGTPVSAGQGSRGGHPWQKQQRSAPGEPPAVQTAQLQSNITYIKPAPLIRHVGTNVKHGLYMEVGTSTIKARPWLRPAFNRNKDKLAKFMKGAV